MAQVTVSIAGRSYRMACADGEESHLRALAAQIDSKINAFRESFGEIGDQRLLVMAAVGVADELAESRRTVARLESEIAKLHEGRESADKARDDWANSVADALETAAERMERLGKDGN